MTDRSEDEKLLISIGIDPKTAAQVTTNPRVRTNTKCVIKAAGVESGCDRDVGNRLFKVAIDKKFNPDVPNLGTILGYITSKKISSPAQIKALNNWLPKATEQFDAAKFEEICGVGVNVTADDVKAKIKELFATHAEELKSKRYKYKGQMFGKVRQALKWADGKVVLDEFEKAILETLGPKNAEDNKKPDKSKKSSKKESAQEEEEKGAQIENMSPEELASLFSGREIPWDKNSDEIKNGHLKRTGGKMRTRFPPEPNGYLHIGHAKAMNFNFGVAKKFGGVCYLRFDDTNPEAEKKEYIDNIVENVKFMGHDPWKITYSSDSFQQLYDFGVQLIKKNKAYVCHMTGDQVKEAKKLKQKQPPSPWRDRPIKESLYEFDRMRRGYYDEGEATLRLKMDITHDNPNMWDIIAFRIIYKAHPHTGDKWCVYPTYDFTHCIIDSLEDITHSCCTLEFENRRESYYWLLDELEIFKPNVWEYGRLNIKNNVLSKRKLKQLVMDNHVRGWDDPRLLTINGLRRRGFTAEGINKFCEDMGVSRSVVVWAPYERLEGCGRAALNVISPRRMVVVDPLKLVITNMKEGEVKLVTCSDFPDQLKELGVNTETKFQVPLTRICYIEKKDFQKTAKKSYFGMTPKKTVRLLHAYNITCTGFDEDAKGNPTTVYCTMNFNDKEKVKKGFLHWVSGDPAEVKVNLYNKLFTAEYPGEESKGQKVDYLTQLNPKSLVVKKGLAFKDFVKSVKVGEHYQFERLGFFYVEPDSKPGKPVFNRTMELSSGKKK
eukprot:CAMPEP_0184501198 /NCGR_PEP_ID=MMETSP0113_2-20130426/46968_1 /TAXON_ID=91329 /ORGANISM="Norrisiella sphaerica, Strain BC52" /LENGTH=774 /DNA_ID=CAMNT_0026889875 /DNA_START=42 /DNA_END=2366 /DNA_ORIENTATION=+